MSKMVLALHLFSSFVSVSQLNTLVMYQIFFFWFIYLFIYFFF